MERRNFVKKISALTTGTLLLSGSNLYSFELENTKNINIINLAPFSFVERQIMLKGSFIDSETIEPIKNVSMKVKSLNNRFSFKQSLNSHDGSYEIRTGLSNYQNKIVEKISVEIFAEGYSPLKTELYLSKFGCNVHSSIWNYNPKINISDCPKNEKNENYTLSQFNFHLVKE